jgi:hypothetical protein
MDKVPIRHDVVCDFPLPCTPQMKAENGMFVLRKILGSSGEQVFPAAELPKSANCGIALESIPSERPAEKSIASFTVLAGKSPLRISGEP